MDTQESQSNCGSRRCSLVDEVLPDEKEEIEAAIAAWIPYWRRPASQAEWDKLVEQKAVFAASAIDTHKQATESDMPLWFRQQTMRSKYTAVRKYARTKRRVELMRLWPQMSPEERLLAVLMYDI